MIKKIDYIPQLDFLRAIAVIWVVLYHSKIEIFNYEIFKGGFLGVDIFFVISGYIITKIALSEYNLNQTISISSFFFRRFKRIFPALFFLILVSTILSFYIMIPIHLVDYSLSSISSLFFLSNLYFHYSGLLYGAQDVLLKPLIHTWSLSIEWQFYIVFPFFFILIFKNLKKDYIFPLLKILIFLSFLCAVYLSKNHISFSFYSPFTRAWEFLVGIHLALEKVESKGNRSSFDLIGLTLIFFSLFFFSMKFEHPSFSTLPSIIGAYLFIKYSKFNNLEYFKNKCLIWVGKISFSIYLWHYFVFSYYRILNEKFTGEPTEIPLYLFLIVIFFSVLSYYYIESPFRKKINYTNKLKNFFLILFIFITLIFNTLSYQKFGFENRIPKNLRLSLIDDRFINFELSKKCHKKISVNDDFCQFNEDNVKKLFILGDSHLESLVYDLINKTKKEYNLVSMTMPGCYLHRIRQIGCTKDFNIKRNNMVLDNKESVVIIGGSLQHYLNINKIDKIKFSRTLERFIKNKNKILLIYPIPDFKIDVRQYLVSNMIKNKTSENKNISLKLSKYYKENKESFQFLDSFKGQNIFRLYPHEIFCSDNKNCLANNGDTLYYVDSNHFTKYGANLINEKILEKLKKINN